MNAHFEEKKGMLKKSYSLLLALLAIVIVGSNLKVVAHNHYDVEVAKIPIVINYEQYNIGDKKNNMLLQEYPMFFYNEILYFPLTYNNCILVGLNIDFKEKTVFLEKRGFTSEPMFYNREYLEKASESEVTVSNCPFEVYVDGERYFDEEFPILFYQDIVYIPMTWNTTNNVLKWDFSFKNTKEKNEGLNELTIFTQSHYYYSKGDSVVNIDDKQRSFGINPGKTYWCKDNIRVYAETYFVNLFGPNGDNMIICKDGKEKTVNGIIGHGQKKGPLFEVEGEYIYTVHFTYDYEKWGSCKINMTSGEIIYTEEDRLNFGTVYLG